MKGLELFSRFCGRKAAAGFSLVELMIVVAIIGVLTSIAIPNFQAFQRRSRQSEAKASLTSIYTAEQTFHSSWEVYTGSLEPAGYVPSGDFRYNIGFDSTQAGFCGESANGIAAMAMIMCGPAPLREYTGVVMSATLTDINAYCAAVANSDSCGILFNSTVAAKLNAGTMDDSATSAVNERDQAIAMGEAGSTVEVNTFSAAAVGDLLGENDDTSFDTWTITEEKKLTNVHNGLEF